MKRLFVQSSLCEVVSLRATTQLLIVSLQAHALASWNMLECSRLTPSKYVTIFSYSHLTRSILQTHMQASGRSLGMSNIARILIKDEGLLRFWKGAHVIASGCVPAHASYFLAYEHLKLFWHVDNDEYSIISTLAIGSSTTFVHDFFITPSDGKQNTDLRSWQ